MLKITSDCMCCGQCEEVCPFHAIIEKKSNGYSQMTIDQDKCQQCEACLDFDCPGEAIKRED